MQIIDGTKLDDAALQKLCKRPSVDLSDTIARLRDVQDEIRANGYVAIRKYTQKFDGVDLENCRVSTDEIKAAFANMDDAFKDAINIAIDNVRRFHETQMIAKSAVTENMQGIQCWRESRPIERVGIYIPGGTAPLFSTLIMTVIPALIAGCPNITICTPPNKDGKIADEILCTAQILGVSNIYKIGGAQAIFGMAYGFETGGARIAPVYKIFGPGNQYITAAKMMIAQDDTCIAAIDMPAGPSEVLVIGNATSNPAFIASDILSQAEHGTDSQSVFVTDDMGIAHAVTGEVDRQLAALPRRDLAAQSIDKSFILYTANMNDAIAFSNAYAPEHLILNMDDDKALLPQIINAGSVFCGAYASESFGDYASGTNHVLPTSAYALNHSGLSVDSFIKKITFQRVTKQGLVNLAPTVELMAAREQLNAHKNAVTIRRKHIEEERAK